MTQSIATFVTDKSISAGVLAMAVEERGFHSLIVTEHSHMPVAYAEPFPRTGAPRLVRLRYNVFAMSDMASASSADEAAFLLPTLAESDALRYLDKLTALAHSTI
ncbi:hypothetical protein [Mycobacterium tilburgii]|uniref:hypothetical protein n=1 Tax=Mycobacterium tilburgii TaxID=44467 RepID=UPI001181F02C|nr:hypothetical protein [Mycobacterium tilburgii]